jgi:hypothetical protein
MITPSTMPIIISSMLNGDSTTAKPVKERAYLDQGIPPGPAGTSNQRRGFGGPGP